MTAPPLTRQDFLKILNSADLGSAVAEHDSLLYEARIETTAFTDLFRDRVDLISGTKGSGKTALYRLISEFERSFMLKSRILILTGVEASGDPVFLAFKDQFEDLTELEFDNFWRVYFVALILERFVRNAEFDEIRSGADKEIQIFKERCRAAHIPELSKSWSFRDIIQTVLQRVKLSFGNVEPSEKGASYSLVSISPAKAELERESETPGEAPMFLHDIHEALVALLKHCDLRLWIMLDRLDEVFPRRTKLEQIALRALLRTTRNFPTETIRIKLFLRDDIFENVLLGSDGFTALSHIEARRAPTLRWGIMEIKMMIIKRLCTSSRVRMFCQADKRRIQENDVEHIKEVFDRIFPPQVMPGKNQSSTIDWIYHHCEDGRGTVTPRDVIDLLVFALKAQAGYLQAGAPISTHLITGQALKEGLSELSKKKCRTYLEAEFPDFWRDIKRFENSKAEHNKDSLGHLLGAKWAEKAEHLVGLGFLQQRPGGTWIVPFVFRAGMGIRQGKAF